MVAQNVGGELILGDSHEYGAMVDPFDKTEIDDLILGYLETFLNAPGLRVAALARRLRQTSRGTRRGD